MAEINVKQLIDKYKTFVIENPIAASELEVALKWISYFAAGRFSQSIVVSELMHSAANLLTFLNDMILRKAANIPVHANILIEKLQIILSMLDYVEVFAEVTARRIGGTKTRWLIIVLFQIIKTVIRLVLVLKFKQGVQKSPPLPPLNRRMDVPQFCSPQNGFPPSLNSIPEPNMEVTFTLKRSKRVIRTLEAAPPLSSRTWKLPKPDPDNCSSAKNAPPTKLVKPQTIGEVVHISRPIAHLFAYSVCGNSSWKPFFLSLAMDCISLHLIRNGKVLNYKERLEISRRSFSLLIYLLRSPLYDNVVEMPLLLFLEYVADKFRGGNLFIRPLVEYLPEWQRTYFYNWGL